MENELINILKDYKGEIIFVTHDRDECYRICDDIVVYDKGLNFTKKEVNELFEKPSTLAEAKITGCKNISKIEYISEDTVYSLDWGIELKVSNRSKQKGNYIGIRERYISIVNKEDENTHYLRGKNIIENPFSYLIYAAKEENEYNGIELEVDKNIKISLGDNILVKLDKKKIFTF